MRTDVEALLTYWLFATFAVKSKRLVMMDATFLEVMNVVHSNAD